MTIEGPSQHVQFLYACLHFRALRNEQTNFSTFSLNILKF